MVEFFTELGENAGFTENYAELIAYIVSVICAALICIAVFYVVRLVLINISAKASVKTKFNWDNILYKHKFFHRLSHLAIPITASFLVDIFDSYEDLLKKFVTVYTVIIVLRIVDSLLETVDEVYRSKEISKVRPIKGFLQVIKVVLIILGGIVAIATLIGQNPTALIGGLGAMTAVISLVFKDAILGFVAGIQLTANDMIRIGDWIEMPKYSADGDVIELSLTTVKVKNFDNTITTIPAYALISDAFINWRGMVGSGARRIKRSIYIDTNTIKICDDEMIARFENMEYLKKYIAAKKEDIKKYNSELNADLNESANGRRLTNIGTFRAYMTEYLKHHPGINHDMTLMVRQLQPGDSGVPLEVYAFTNTTVWEKYEGIQSDIFDHFFAVASRFYLRIFQQPSGSDINTAAQVALGKKNNPAD